MTLNPQGMLHATFTHRAHAEQWRDGRGGWLFVAKDRTIWFSLAYTPSDIMRDEATRGLSGELVSAPATRNTWQ